MQRQVIWETLAEPGLEHLRLHENDLIGADGLIVGVVENQPIRLHYEVRCDSQYRFIMVRVSLYTPVYSSLLLSLDADGFWRTDKSDMPLPQLQGCLDIDVSATPFTNTLPIRRLGLQPGESAEIKVAYIAIPTLQISAAQPRSSATPAWLTHPITASTASRAWPIILAPIFRLTPLVWSSSIRGFFGGYGWGDKGTLFSRQSLGIL